MSPHPENIINRILHFDDYVQFTIEVVLAIHAVCIDNASELITLSAQYMSQSSVSHRILSIPIRAGSDLESIELVK